MGVRCMKDGIIKVCFAMGTIVVTYAIYAFTNQEADGVVFASIVAALSALGGYTIATVAKGE